MPTSQTPQKAFGTPLLETLYELGNRAQAQQVRDAMDRKIKDGKLGLRLGPADHRPVSESRDPRWWNATQWNRHYLVQNGILRGDSERGVWELTDEGIKLVENLIEKKRVHYVAIKDFNVQVDIQLLSFKQGQDIPDHLVDQFIKQRLPIKRAPRRGRG